jgi:hypothetical protein
MARIGGLPIPRGDHAGAVRDFVFKCTVNPGIWTAMEGPKLALICVCLNLRRVCQSSVPFKITYATLK